MRAQILPPAVRFFFLKAFICFVTWQTAYLLLLKPERRLDKHITYFTACCTSSLLSAAYGTSVILSEPPAEIILVNGRRTLGIADGCNALELFVLYIAFLICMPGTVQRRTLFALTGVPAIYVLNVLRCCAIAWLHLNHPQMVDFAHHYLFAVVVYGFIFFMLVQYSKKIRQEKKMESIK